MKNKKNNKAIVVGAGIGGIATALWLRKKGYKVTVLEASAEPGGKLSQFTKAGFRFDMGPSLFTLPQFVDELFALFGENASENFRYRKLDVICKYMYEDGTCINAFQDVNKFAEEIEKKAGVKKSTTLKYLQKSAQLYHLTAEVFIFRSFHKLSTFLSKKFIRSLLRWYKLDVFSTMHKVNEKTFGDSRIVRLFDRYATYNGSNPYSAPATLNVIPHLEHNLGAYFPEKGMYDIIEQLYQLAVRQGILFEFSTPVQEILIKNRKVKGVKVNGFTRKAHILISNADVVPTYRLMNTTPLPEKYLRQERSTSALIFYWGVNKQFPGLDLHNILFSEDYEGEFHSLFKTHTVFDDPTVYIFISSRKVTKDAPQGCENWFTMINVPANTGQDWDALIKAARANIISKINRMLKTDIERYIKLEECQDPRIIEQRTSSYQGSLYGTSSNNRFAAFRRHPNFSKIKNLFFVGGSVHPGGGIPLCLSSAKITEGFISSQNKN